MLDGPVILQLYILLLNKNQNNMKKLLILLFVYLSSLSIYADVVGGGGFGFMPNILGNGWTSWTDTYNDATRSLIFSNVSGAVIKFTKTNAVYTIPFGLPSDVGNTLVNLPVTAATAGGTKIGYTNKINNIDVMRFFAYSDGSGGTTNITVDIKGTSGAIPAPSGYVGEVITSKVGFGSAVGMSSGFAANVTSISLTAGDWDVSGNINFNYTSATVTGNAAGINTVSATMPVDGTEVSSGVRTTTLSEIDGITVSTKQINVATTTTVYLIGLPTFSAGSCSCYGSIMARRIR